MLRPFKHWLGRGRWSCPRFDVFDGVDRPAEAVASVATISNIDVDNPQCLLTSE